MPDFFKNPILNSPYTYPGRHWELEGGQPSGNVIEKRRSCSYLTPIPKSKNRKKDAEQADLFTDQPKVSVEGVEYDPTSIVNQVRGQVDTWRNLPESQWGVTPTTARLLRHWRTHDFATIRPFFCQIEAVETAIWLAEVAPKLKGKNVFNYNNYLKGVNADANPDLFRIALKLATGAGKTMVMSMLIAWQTANAVRTPGSKKYSKAFLIIAPGITIRDRLRVLLPNDTESYYNEREILPRDMMGDIEKAKIVITNYHAFQRREKMDVSKGTRRVLEGRAGEPMATKETEGEMVRRVMGELMGEKVIVINDEAHHCYRMKSVGDFVDTVDGLTGDEKTEAKKENEFARMWITGIEAVKRQMGVVTVYDLSATPFFLSGSGYREGTLFPWVMSDFSLMDAIECGIVKLPRVPVADNVSADMPKLRNLWEHIGKKMPKGKGGKAFDPKQLPPLLQTGLHALYGHYEKTDEMWKKAGVQVPPVFIIVCSNVKASKAVYDWVSGWEWENADGNLEPNEGRLPLFRNFNEHGDRVEKPRSLLIDSQQLESGDALDASFRKVYATEIERFRREKVERTSNPEAGKKIPDSELLREVMNTVGQKGKLGEHIRCVVSVSMLTEGWDANTVTHILGIRAFGTQLLCEQVVGRGLRRLNYTTDDEGKFGVEYADILGIPFDFTAKSEGGEIVPPPPFEHIHAVRPDRDHLEITFPHVDGYRIELPKETIQAKFTDNSKMRLSPEEVGPTKSIIQGIVGEGIELTVDVLASIRPSAISYALAKELLFRKFADADGSPKMHLFLPLQKVARQWINECVDTVGGAQLAQLLYPSILDDACERIRAAITEAYLDERPVMAIIDPHNPIGSSSKVNFRTTKPDIWEPDSSKSHVNKIVCDSGWEAQFCRAVESHPRVLRYVKNQGLGLEVPYRDGEDNRRYVPDFIVVINLGDEENPELLNLIVEVKGYRRENEKAKQNTMRTYWVPGVNNLKTYGRWAFAEFSEVYGMDEELEELITKGVNEMIEKAATAEDPVTT